MTPTLEEGYAHHQQGRLAEAERIYLQALEREPRNFNAWHLLGVLALQMGQTQRGVELIGRALAIDPAYPAAHNNLGRGLQALGQFEPALAAYDRALRLKPDYVAVYNNRALTLLALGRLAEALASAERALVLKPDYPEALNHRGLALKDLGRLEDAAEFFARATTLLPDFEEAYNNHGVTLDELKRHDEALLCHDKALAIRPELAEFHANRAASLRGLLRHREALADYERAIALKGDFAPFHSNRGTTLSDLGRDEEALASFDHAILLDPAYAEAWLYRGNTLKNLGRFDEAATAYEKSQSIKPNFSEAIWSRSLLHLLLGEFAAGWPLYEDRLRERVVLRTHVQPRWRGEDLAGKTLLVEGEQGLGDMIQFSRLALLAAERGAKILLSAIPSMMRLLQSLGPQVTVIANDVPPPAFDFHIPLMSLPLAFGLGEEVPAQTPYLHAEPELVAKWQDRIGAEGFKIGVCWQGAATDRSRSFPLAALANIAARHGVRLISLQKGEGSEQLKSLPPGMIVEQLGADFDAGPDALVDTAAAMASLDLIITLDTSLAHLAGALERPAWVALKRVPDWRWRLVSSASRWYPSLKLTRQPARGDWDGLFAIMEKDLSR